MASLNLREKANFTRLSRLLVDKGCEALRKTFDSINPPASLTTVLNAKKRTLLRLPKGIISVFQWDLLFPLSGNAPHSKNFDITLLTVLLRNICGLHPPGTGWNTMPSNGDNSPAANITRIKILRNKVYAHVSLTEIDNATFENLWQDVSNALIALKIPLKEIDDLKICPLSLEEEMYKQRLKEWYQKDKDYKDILDGLNTDIKLIKAQLQYLLSTTAETHRTTQRLSRVSTEQRQIEHSALDSGVNAVRETSYSSKEAQLLKNLAKQNFKSKIRSKVNLFHPGTREWLFKTVESWFTKEEESIILLIKADPGFGKSVFAAKICGIFKENDKFAACHFCDYSDSNLKDPMMMIQSLASHMTENIPGFKEKLVDQLQRPHKVNNLKDAFQIYLQNPLDEIEVEPRLIVIDGLDESTTEYKSEMVKLIGDHFSDLPKCVKVLITSRPEISLNTLQHISTIKILKENEKCDLDLLKYLKDNLPSLANRDAKNTQTDHDVYPHDSVPSKIIKKCEGSFLYAFHVQRELQKRKDLDSISTEEIMLLLPKGMESTYEEYFRRLDKDLKSILKRKFDLCQLLELLVAANSLLPLSFIARALGLDLDCRETAKIINSVNDAVSCVLHVSNEEVTVFHKSVFDWLLLKDKDIHQYTVKVADGKRRLWLLCQQIYQEIKSDVIAERKLKRTKEVTHALEYGLEYLLACNMKESFHWLVDMIIVHVCLTFHPKHSRALRRLWRSALSCDEDINFQLRQRISWHLTEIESMNLELTDPLHHYLEFVLDHSPQTIFTNDEIEIAKALLGKYIRYVKHYSDRKKSLKRFLGKYFPHQIKAIGLSSSKKLAAVALQDGTIRVVSLPNLVELFQHQTDCKNISCCTFTPDDSVVLYGKLEIGLSVLEKTKISFFSGKVEAFASCGFSPDGKRLVTNDGSSTIKLWDVSRRSLLFSLDAGVPLKSCSFSKTGLFIIGDSKDTEEDSYCVWNAITLQRADLRNLCQNKNKNKALQRSAKCNRCINKAYKELTPSKVVNISTGIYNEVECIFCGDCRSLFVIESTHYTVVEAWGLFIMDFPDPLSFITTIKDNVWLVCDGWFSGLYVFSFEEPTKNQSCLSFPTVVVWCSFSPDGTRIATYTSDGFINLWNVESCQVYERFRNSTDILSGACWWSTEYLFVCHLQDGVANLSKYPVDENFDIKITQNIPVSLHRVFGGVLPSCSKILDFSEGLIFFTCNELCPVKVVNVNVMEYPTMVSLPEITSAMSIVVSPGASFILGNEATSVIVWKRIEADPLSYLVHMRLTPEVPFCSQWCFNDDLKFAFAVVPSDNFGICVDLVDKVCKSRVVKPDIEPGKVFFTKGILVNVSCRCIYIFDSKEFKSLQSIYPESFTVESVLKSRLSPNGNMLAVPTVIGDVDFFQILHSGSF